MGEILDQIGDKGFTISRLRMLDFRSKELQQLFGSDEVPRLVFKIRDICKLQLSELTKFSCV